MVKQSASPTGEAASGAATNTSLDRKELIQLAAQLAGSYLQANPKPVEEIGAVVHMCVQVLTDMNKSFGSARIRLPATPAVPIAESVTDDYVVCLEDGKRLRMLKRHLSTVYKMSIEEYKERWGLGPDYPIVAPSYARRRSAIAKHTGLGKTGRRGRLKVIESRAGTAIVG